MSVRFVHEFQVNFDEVDPGGIVFFANAYIYAHRAFERFIASLELDTFFTIEDYIVPFVHTECDHKSPMRHREQLRTEVHVEHLGNSSMKLRFSIRGDQNIERAEVRTVHVFTNAVTFKPVTIPDEVRVKLLD